MTLATLYVNGDSHSAGHDAGGPSFSYGKYIADTLKMKFYCEAVPACSNDSIINRTLKYLEHSDPDLLIIGWSTWERETWHYGDQTYNINASGTDNVHPNLIDRYRQWVINSCTPEFQHRKEEENHVNIWNFHNLLKEKKIKHLFFNCYSYFHYISTRNKSRYEWGDNYVDPYSRPATYYFWLEQQGFIPANSRFYHYGTDAHMAWAQRLLEYINKL